MRQAAGATGPVLFAIIAFIGGAIAGEAVVITG